ncbi:Uncharacterised protein [Pseudomonas putida]|jgi:hypothetical protein|nr:Uncharacterised protein [Pseudomonas putida]
MTVFPKYIDLFICRSGGDDDEGGQSWRKP